jgi:rhodanese-related sulfurtransferase
MIIDVRQKHEFDRQKIRNAMNIDIMNPSFRDKVSNLDKEKTYFVYCQSGGRSARACGMMCDLGFTKVVNLSGGMSAYRGKTV